MFLDAVKKVKETKIIETNVLLKTREVFEKWKNWHPSQISHHGQICCEIAREWITSTDFSELNGGNNFTGPRWLRQKFNWGASSFPIFWCEAVRKKTLDCGALAALAHEVFTVREVKSFRAQLIQKFSVTATRQWTSNWRDEGDNVPLRWIENDLIYHEGCAILSGEKEIKVWDASAGWWIDPKPGYGYGALLAIRVSSNDVQTKSGINWGMHRILPNKWQKIR
jgi:hypothetical protein